MQNRLAAILLILVLHSALHNASGQKMVNSPFGRFNLGTIEPAGSFRSLGMGGTSTAVRDNNSVYFSNPASYSSFDTNSFVFDFGLDYGINILTDDTSRYFSDDINFDHLLIGFPVGRRFGVATGIIPFSNGYYSISETVLEGDPDFDPVTGAYTELHSGNGGITNFFAGTGVRLTKNLSAGINMTLLFGQIRRINQFYFADYGSTYHNNSTEKLQLNGMNLDYGLQYSASIKKDYFINAGVSMSSGKKYKSNYEKIVYRYNYYGATDTLSRMVDSSGVFLPGTVRIGLAFGKKNKLTVAFDYVSTKWTAATLHGSEGYLADTKSLLLGVEFIPDKFSNYSYLKRIEYRIGTHIEDNYLMLNGEQIKEIGVSIGIGLPMDRTFSFSKTNLFIDYTRKSGPGGLLHTENYFTMGASLNIYDFWFMKRKYD
jgi:hypothetical protein